MEDTNWCGLLDHKGFPLADSLQHLLCHLSGKPHDTAISLLFGFLALLKLKDLLFWHNLKISDGNIACRLINAALEIKDVLLGELGLVGIAHFNDKWPSLSQHSDVNILSPRRDESCLYKELEEREKKKEKKRRKGKKKKGSTKSPVEREE